MRRVLCMFMRGQRFRMVRRIVVGERRNFLLRPRDGGRDGWSRVLEFRVEALPICTLLSR